MDKTLRSAFKRLKARFLVNAKDSSGISELEVPSPKAVKEIEEKFKAEQKTSAQ